MFLKGGIIWTEKELGSLIPIQVHILIGTTKVADLDTSDKTQRESDIGHIPGRYQWEETVDVSADDEDNDNTEDD